MRLISGTDAMTVVREPAVAGRFYPDDPAELRSAVRSYIERAEKRSGPPKAIIVPHAGYVYSGPVAGSGYAQLVPLRGRIERVVLLGPAHYVPFRGLAASSAAVFKTPLGPVSVDTEAMATLLRLPQVQMLDAAHAREHSLEVHLPFLQETLGQFQVVPLVVGQTTTEEVTQVLTALWGGAETLIVISSDLSHYHDYEMARRLDRETSETIEHGLVDRLQADRACGFLGIGGLLSAAAERGLHVRTLDLRSSGDTAGPRDRVVGYGAYVVAAGEEQPAAETSRERQLGQASRERQLPDSNRQASACGSPSNEADALQPGHERMLLETARAAIERGLSYGMKPEIDANVYPTPLQAVRATFVTLTRQGELRGCMGSLKAVQPLVCDVASNTFSSAFLDPRFPPLTLPEADDLDIHISVLSPPEPLRFESEADLLQQLRPGVDGLILYEQDRRGTLLPAVWEKLPEPRQFLATVKQKAGLPSDYWSPTVRAERYTATCIPR